MKRSSIRLGKLKKGDFFFFYEDSGLLYLKRFFGFADKPERYFKNCLVFKPDYRELIPYKKPKKYKNTLHRNRKVWLPTEEELKTINGIIKKYEVSDSIKNWLK